MPQGCVFTGKGPAAFDREDSSLYLLSNCALMNSAAYKELIGTRLNAADSTARSFEVGIIQKTPAPLLKHEQRLQLGGLAKLAWALKYVIDTIHETSHAFLLPLALRQAQGERLRAFEPPAIEAELAHIQAEIDDITFDLYGFSNADRASALGNGGNPAM